MRVRVSKIKNITKAKTPNHGATIRRTILNIKRLCFPGCVPELLLLHFTEIY